MTRTHVKALTYAPKILRVLAGELTQTIRPRGRAPVAVGDTILFHGWSGKPYRSPWSWRRHTTVTAVQNVLVTRSGIALDAHELSETTMSDDTRIRWTEYKVTPWHDPAIDHIAQLDGFENGLQLGAYLNKHYYLETPTPFQIITFRLNPAVTRSITTITGGTVTITHL